MIVYEDGTFVFGSTEEAIPENARVIPDDSEEAFALLTGQEENVNGE